MAGPAAGDTDNAERDSSGGVAGGGDSGLTVADILSALYEYAQVALRGLLLLLLDEAHTPRPGVDTVGAGAGNHYSQSLAIHCHVMGKELIQCKQVSYFTWKFDAPWLHS